MIPSVNAAFDSRYGTHNYHLGGPVSSMRSVTPREGYHVVCRECSVERLFETDGDATRFERKHVKEADHHLVVGHVR